MTPFYQEINPEILYGHELDQLLAWGWYRMHQTIFTCSHIEHNSELYRVHWLRYSCQDIKNRTAHRRIKNRNTQFRHIIEDAISISQGHLELHARYRESINFDGARSIEECLFGDEKPCKSIFATKCISIFDGEKLIAGGYFDVGDKAAASILHFFDPAYSRFSLGKYLILLTLDYLKLHNYTWYYPGYVVAGVPKMDYKLFLGKEEAYYFDPESVSWRFFEERILVHQPLKLGRSS